MTQSIDTPTQPAPTLRALPGGRAASAPSAATSRDASGRADSRDECTISRAATRAGDRHEPWTLPASPALERLADTAHAAGVEFELAARLAIEHALACADLRALGIAPAALDAAAAGERVAGELDAADCAYLRRLTQRREVARRDDGELVCVGLPARLTARLLQADLDALLAAAAVEQALAWEIAAVVSGRTISEWAPLTALRTLAPAAATR